MGTFFLNNIGAGTRMDDELKMGGYLFKNPIIQ
jgi:hypothetical protein